MSNKRGQVFSERLEVLKNLSNKSYNQIEKDLGYPRNSLQNYRNGGIPSAIRLIEIAAYFKIDPNYLVGRGKLCTSKTVQVIFDELDSNEKREMVLLCHKWLLTNL